jgi:hypothetical protein
VKEERVKTEKILALATSNLIQYKKVVVPGEDNNNLA